MRKLVVDDSLHRWKRVNAPDDAYRNLSLLPGLTMADRMPQGPIRRDTKNKGTEGKTARTPGSNEGTVSLFVRWCRCEGRQCQFMPMLLLSTSAPSLSTSHVSSMQRNALLPYLYIHIYIIYRCAIHVLWDTLQSICHRPCTETVRAVLMPRGVRGRKERKTVRGCRETEAWCNFKSLYLGVIWNLNVVAFVHRKL